MSMTNQLSVVYTSILIYFLPDTYKIGMIYALVNRYFRYLSSNRTHILKEKGPTVEKKPQQLGLPYLGTISLQTRTKLQKSTKRVLNSCKLQSTFKSQNEL